MMFEYRKGDLFLERAVDILHGICKKEPTLAFGYKGGRSGKACLRKLLHSLDCYNRVRSCGEPLDLVKDFFRNSSEGLSEIEKDYLYEKLFVKGGWKSLSSTRN